MAPLFHALLQAYGARTGVPVLLNTSFNLAGEPIVNRATEGLFDLPPLRNRRARGGAVPGVEGAASLGTPGGRMIKKRGKDAARDGRLRERHPLDSVSSQLDCGGAATERNG